MGQLKQAFIGSSWLAKTLISAGSKFEGPMSKMLLGAGKGVAKNLEIGFGEAASKGLNYLSKFKNPGHLLDPTKLGPAGGIAQKDFLGISRDAIGTMPEVAKNKGIGYVTGGITRGIGNQAANLKSILQGGEGFTSKNPIGRTVEFLGKEWNASKFRTGDAVNGVTPVFRRSALGRVAMPLATTGVGIGAISAATATNEDGTSASIGKRVRVGAAESLKWGVGAPFMAGKFVAYDGPKMLTQVMKNKNRNNSFEQQF